MKKFIVALFIALGILALVGAPSASAAPAHAATMIITFDADGSGLPVAEAATDWSKNTDIAVGVGDCTGANCVHFKVVDFACGRGAPIGGCAYRVADGSCQVEMSAWAYDRGVSNPNNYIEHLITKHEAGHCIFSYGGASQSFHLPDKPHALMSATQSSSPSRQEATLTSHDRSFTRSLF